MARTRQDRINREVRDALRAIHYIDRERDKGHDVSRLDEKYRVAKERLVRHRRCFCCGEEITNEESLKAWESDRLGPVCRGRLEQVAS